MDKVFVAQRVATKLFTAEGSLDKAMIDATELMSEMLKARAELNVSAALADDSQAKLMQALTALSAARTAMMDVHGALAEAKLRVGIRTKMAGELDKPFAAQKTTTVMREVG